MGGELDKSGLNLGPSKWCWRKEKVCGTGIRLHFHRLKNQDRLPHITIRVCDDLICHVFWRRTRSRPLRHMIEHREHLVAVGCRDAYKQATTLDWRNEPRSAVGAKYDAQIGHVFLHGPSECGLRIARERVSFIDDDHYH